MTTLRLLVSEYACTHKLTLVMPFYGHNRLATDGDSRHKITLLVGGVPGGMKRHVVRCYDPMPANASTGSMLSEFVWSLMVRSGTNHDGAYRCKQHRPPMECIRTKERRSSDHSPTDRIGNGIRSKYAGGAACATSLDRHHTLRCDVWCASERIRNGSRSHLKQVWLRWGDYAWASNAGALRAPDDRGSRVFANTIPDEGSEGIVHQTSLHSLPLFSIGDGTVKPPRVQQSIQLIHTL